MTFETINLSHRKRAVAPAHASPVRTLLYLSSQGVVFKSTCMFDPGTRLAVGLHLQKIRGDLGLCEHDDGLYGDRFLQLQGVVADCKIVTASPAGRCYQVTLIFDNLEEGDRLLLNAIERALHDSSRRDAGQNSSLASAIPGAGGLN